MSSSRAVRSGAKEEEERTFTRRNSFLLPYILDDYTVPDRKACSLSVSLEGSQPEWFDLEQDFVPLRGCSGSAEGQPIFLGFGIHGGSGQIVRYPGFYNLAGRAELFIKSGLLQLLKMRRRSLAHTTQYPAFVIIDLPVPVPERACF